jgi:chemotaxis protein methyltransferase CheR
MGPIAELQRNAAAASQAELLDPIYLHIRDLIYKVSGIYQGDEKLRLLSAACTRRMKEVKAATPAQYWDFLIAHPSRDNEIRQLLNEVTIADTCLYRNPSQIAALRKTIFPELVAAKSAKGTRLRIWSAGCSTGEEPYSVAIALLEESALFKNWDVEILATDLNDRSLEAAQTGVYDDYALHNIPGDLRRKYFSPASGGKYQIAAEAQKLVQFSRLNLTEDSQILQLKDIDVILCCNVLVHFDGYSKSRVIDNFFASLVSGGYLFLGACESLLRLNDRFRVVHFPGTIAYWKPAESETR